ncbi:MAG: Peptidase M1 membrane alanine aminopeptidase [Chlorobi bacterium OLB5]|nr:MAG: Peptidase M1 membrane alanine aminopeptidase [Chlorobi bacterium OLB5]
MKRFYNPVYILLLTVIFNFNVYSQMFGQEPTERKSNFDVQHIKLDISVDPVEKFVTGKAFIKLVTAEENFTGFELDAAGMNIKNVELDPNGPMIISYVGKTKRTGYYLKTLKFDYNKSKLKIYLDSSYNLSDTLNFIIHYNTTNPEKGLYFISPTAEFPDKRYEVWSQGEGEDNRYWFPCYDYPNDMATTEMLVTVSSQYQTISNGVLKEKSDKLNYTTWHWVNDKPHVSYLVMLGIGQWDTISTSWDGIPIISYVPPGKKSWGQNSYRQTADIMKFFSEYIGYRYPWGEFRQVAVQDFIYGGMENTGAVVLFEGSVYDEKTEPDYSATGLVAHELAHQWWGDVVTCKNWNEIWLNESFATYFQCLYREHELGKDEFDYNIYRNGNEALNADSLSRRPIYTRSGPTANTYDKGSVVLNMLRWMIGDEKFRKTMNIYITQNQFKPVVTKNFADALHNAIDDPLLDQMPANLTWFFEEWIYKAGQPEIKADYSFDENTNELILNAVQVQRMDSSSVFRTPFPIEIVTEKGTQSITMETSSEVKTYRIKLDGKSLNVNFNKGNKILCKLYFTKPKNDWLYQLNNSTDAIDRITALNGLKDFIDESDVVDAVKQVMRNDSFWGVRYEAVKVFAGSENPAAVEHYMKYMIDEKDSRVRRAYLLNLKKLLDNHPAEKENISVLQYFLTNLINYETSYYAAADAVTALSQLLPKDKIYDAVIPYIEMDSHVDIIRRSVLTALDLSDDPRSKEILLKYAVYGSTARVRNIAVNGLGSFLNDDEVINLLNNKLAENTRSTQGVILSLLGKAKNPSSKPFLQKLYDTSNDERFKERIKTIISSY